mmetsp:Transcript_8054/g.19700  ORF Transcript_8054/g.19700 Transcript_8054/m.19700 type:complete len:264 (+) Transcript_8054:60-851(+)|eukprot:CAMPEP_0114497262 /NCGR_PEP_ID=MMETSP0109-20121206/6227_1 /TAXON_ID=29199 /ORGANISM="Chlorarachnion reptans, Strain CCCM449" /LENGTH=263 /DNA_ID=CAMNT_0001674625 /DNA_START=36 /DNA_END=827 /DNA_ORIENTATION=+
MGSLIGKKKSKSTSSGGKKDTATTDNDAKNSAEAAQTPAGAYNFWEKNGKNTLKKPPRLSKRQMQANETIKATMKATLGGGDLQATVCLPEGEDKKEWIAVNTVHFYNAASMIYGTISEDCLETKPECKVMSAGKRYEYLWQDGKQYKKPCKMSAPEYIDTLLTWAGEQIADPNLFPVDPGAKFPSGFMKQVKVIYKRLFRVYGHIYHGHFDKIKSLGANAHLNTCFKHFIYFVKEFNLIKEQDLEPLKKLIDKFYKKKSGPP